MFPLKNLARDGLSIPITGLNQDNDTLLSVIENYHTPCGHDKEIQTP